jgi:IS5 family transposase
MKARIGVDAGTGTARGAGATGANVHDMDAAPKLIRADDDVVNGDAGYTGIEEREEIKNDKHLSKTGYRINRRNGADKKRSDKLWSSPMSPLDYIAQAERDRHYEYMKSKVRREVEHVFAVIKNKSVCLTAVYRGLKKNPLGCICCFAARIRRARAALLPDGGISVPFSHGARE